MASGKQSVLVYRFDYLPLSETFIADHIRSLTRWHPIPIYERWIPSEINSRPQAWPITAQQTYLARLESNLFTRLGRSGRLDQIVRDSRPRLIHVHFLTNAVRVIRYARRMGLPLVVTAHGSDASIHDDELAKSGFGRRVLRMRKLLIETVSAVFCVSEFIRDQLLERGFPAEKLFVQHLGIDMADFEPGQPAGHRKGALFVGRLVEKKGPGRLIDAWKLLPQEVRAQGLTIIGGGPEEGMCREKAAGCADIKMLGPQPRDVIRRAMTESRVLAMPSLRAKDGDSEGLPIVAMEGQAKGTPIVVFRQAPMTEAVIDGLSGLAVSPDGNEPFAEALGRILVDDQLASRLGEGGVARARETFDLATNVAALERLYDRFGLS